MVRAAVQNYFNLKSKFLFLSDVTTTSNAGVQCSTPNPTSHFCDLSEFGAARAHLSDSVRPSFEANENKMTGGCALLYKRTHMG